MAAVAFAFVMPAAAKDTSSEVVFQPRDLVCNYHSGHCYLIDPMNTTSMTWYDAVDFCQKARTPSTISFGSW